MAIATNDFHAARYNQLALSLPRFVPAARAVRDAASADERSAACTLLAEAYIVAANFAVKLNEDTLAWIAADRALQAAQDGDDPLTLADARRAVATVLRRTGSRTSAREFLAAAARGIEPRGRAPADQLAMYGTLLEVAAYTAAVDGSRSAAAELIGEARGTAARLDSAVPRRFTTFGPASIVLYRVSIDQVLGDSGTAIEHARKLSPAAIATPERKGRYWIDVARAFHQWNKPEPCYRALLSAERAAPDEVRYRPPVHRITEDLLRADNRRTLPGLREFASRIGMPTG